MTTIKVNLPGSVGIWTKSDSVKMIDSDNIFKYMNGAGELYLAYRFDHLEVYKYTSKQQPDIIVEIYEMKNADDAFGLISLDWGGEPVTYASDKFRETAISPSHRALYGAGLLRIWADKIYVRVLANRETVEAKKAVLAIGKEIAANCKIVPEPEMLKMLPVNIDPDLKLQRNRIGFFRSHLVLNSMYYLSHKNITGLDHSAEAFLASYEKKTDTEISKRIQVLCVQYATPEHALSALESFYKAYVPEHLNEFTKTTGAMHSNYYKIEDGWSGCRLKGNQLVLIFESPDRQTAQKIADNILPTL
ncbi:MAG: hypothetical protein GY795_02480 [Desulfobacterales bacterium]|nr:hypothetical protein [Desulfobacterales bacterium]